MPADAAAANKIFARMDAGACTHAGRATYVSEIEYNKSNCVGGNTGDSAVAMGRIGWQDAMARHAVGDAAAIAMFTDTLLAPLQADLKRRTWLPERFNCDGTDAHSAQYFEVRSAQRRSAERWRGGGTRRAHFRSLGAQDAQQARVHRPPCLR